jgi:hypothetical protein
MEQEEYRGTMTSTVTLTTYNLLFEIIHDCPGYQFRPISFQKVGSLAVERCVSSEEWGVCSSAEG